jgi:hypothetical protein
VVPDDEDSAIRGYPFEPAYLGAEIDIYQLAIKRERFTNEVLIASLQQLPGGRAKQVAGGRCDRGTGALESGTAASETAAS